MKVKDGFHLAMRAMRVLSNEMVLGTLVLYSARRFEVRQARTEDGEK